MKAHLLLEQATSDILTSSCTITESYIRSENLQKYLGQGEKVSAFLISTLLKTGFFLLKLYLMLNWVFVLYLIHIHSNNEGWKILSSM